MTQGVAEHALEGGEGWRGGEVLRRKGDESWSRFVYESISV